MNKMVRKAMRIAQLAHEGQTDKGGYPYIGHVMRVYKTVCEDFPSDYEAQAVALLHDVVEDTYWSLEDLKKEKFTPVIIAGVDAITKRSRAEKSKHYFKRVCENQTAMRVKLADLKDNTDLTRLQKPTKRDLARTEHYKRMYEKILTKLQ